MKHFTFFFVLSLLALSPFAFADIPRLISLQGRLTDASDNPITSVANFVFRIYTSSSGGTFVWNETQNSIVSDSNGVFSSLLGSVNALNIPFNESYWLEVQVQSGTKPTEILSPRQRLGSAGYAIRAESTSATSGGGWNVYKNDGATLIGRFVSYLGDVSCTSMIYNPSGTTMFSQPDSYNCNGPAYSSEYLFFAGPDCSGGDLTGADVRGPFINSNQYYTCTSNYMNMVVFSYRTPGGTCVNWNRSRWLYTFCNSYTPAPWICNGGGSGPCVVK